MPLLDFRPIEIGYIINDLRLANASHRTLEANLTAYSCPNRKNKKLFIIKYL